MGEPIWRAGAGVGGDTGIHRANSSTESPAELIHALEAQINYLVQENRTLQRANSGQLPGVQMSFA